MTKDVTINPHMQAVGYLDAVISNKLLEEQIDNKRKQELHGKLSGSILGKPLQEQILHILQIPEKDIDSYTLRKFQRGHHCEAWLIGQIPGLMDVQEGITYRGVTGHVDAVVDMAEWELPELGKIPHEIKSTTRTSIRWIKKSKEAKWSHKLQAALYALALEADHYMLHYICADDYELVSFLYKTKDIAKEVDDIIDEVYEQLTSGIIPEFVPREDWNNNPDYQGYPTWAILSQQDIMKRLKKEYPDAYKRLLAFRDRKEVE